MRGAIRLALPPQTDNDFSRLLPVVLLGGPARALGHHKHEDDEEPTQSLVRGHMRCPRERSHVQRWNGLKGEGYSIGGFALDVQQAPVVDPE